MKSQGFVLVLFLLLTLSPALQAAPIRCQQLHAIPKLNAEFGTEQTVYRDGYFFRLVQVDSSKKDSLSYQRAEHYLNHDAMVSLRNLNKSGEFYERLESTNPEILKNSWFLLIYSTRDTENPIGGAAFAIARDRSESLPMESELQTKIFGDKIEAAYPIAEISRVGVNPSAPALKEAPGKIPPFQALIHMISAISSAPSNIRHFYGFTTTAHQALYRYFGHKTETKADPISLPQLPDKLIILEVLR